MHEVFFLFGYYLAFIFEFVGTPHPNRLPQEAVSKLIVEKKLICGSFLMQWRKTYLLICKL